MDVKSIIRSLLAIWLLAGCSAGDNVPAGEAAGETLTVNVDVVLPAAIWKNWQNVTEWAQRNIAKAQQKQTRRVKLNLRFHDEDTADLEALAMRLANPKQGEDTCHAIIGPYHSDHAQTFLSYAAQTRLPVIMPTCTSAELQRIHTHNTYAWFLTESDITQCEIMVSTARALNDTDVALIYSPDTYGNSFAEWFAYFAAEQDIHIAGGIKPYRKGDDIGEFMNEVVEDAKGKQIRILVALSDAGDYKPVCDQILTAKEARNEYTINPICSDTSYDMQVLSAEDFISFNFAVTPWASMRYGFPQSYYGHFIQWPINGEAQMYDALSLIALGAAYRMTSPNRCIINGQAITNAPGLTDYMRALVGSDEGIDTQWDANGLAIAFNELANGRLVDISGASGALAFDMETRTKVLNTTYMIWRLDLESVLYESDPYLRVMPLLYVSTEGDFGEASTTSIWQFEKIMKQIFDEGHENHRLPAVREHWAVVVSPSTKWGDYRHQADAFAMYQLLRQYGYDDDHIVLIVEDNLAFAPENRDFPGQIFVERSTNDSEWGMLVNENVRKDAVVDYHFSDLRQEDIADIMTGRESARLPHVIRPDSTSNVFLFWSGHGSLREGPLWGGEDAREGFGNSRILNIVTEMNERDMYRRMMLAVETCFSGQWGEVLTGLPDVLILTASNAMETSKADVFDQELGVYLSNAFSRTFRSKIGMGAGINIYDLYRELYKTTAGSHVTIYNHTQYGSVYTEKMTEFFPM